MRTKRYFKPAMVFAACMALVVATTAFGSAAMNKANKGGCFSICVNAKELTDKKESEPTKFVSYASGLCETEKHGIAYGLDFPVVCKGKNIDTITYSIKEGCFQISNPGDSSIIIDSQKYGDKFLNVPAQAADDNCIFNKYKSFTVDYSKQADKKTCISIANSSDIWNKDKQLKYKKLNFKWSDATLEEEKKVMDLLVEDMGIKCTVKYKDGTTETKEIVISTKIMNSSVIYTDEKKPYERNDDMVAIVYSLK